MEHDPLWGRMNPTNPHRAPPEQARHPPGGGGGGAGKSFGSFFKAKQTPKHNPDDPFGFTESQSSEENGQGGRAGRGGGAFSGQRGARPTPPKNPPLVKQKTSGKRAAKRDFTFDMSDDDDEPAPSKAPPASSARSSATPAKAPPARSTSHALPPQQKPPRETGAGGDRARGGGAFSAPRAGGGGGGAAPPPMQPRGSAFQQQQKSQKERETEQRSHRERERGREKEREEEDAVSGATRLFHFEGITSTCTAFGLDKKVGPITPPQLPSHRVAADTQIKLLLERCGWRVDDAVVECETMGDILAACGHHRNVLTYTVQELRNLLSSAGFRYWKQGSALDEVFLPSHISVRWEKGVIAEYVMCGVDAKAKRVIYARNEPLPPEWLDLDQTGGTNAKILEELPVRQTKPRKAPAKKEPPVDDADPQGGKPKPTKAAKRSKPAAASPGADERGSPKKRKTPSKAKPAARGKGGAGRSGGGRGGEEEAGVVQWDDDEEREEEKKREALFARLEKSGMYKASAPAPPQKKAAVQDVDSEDEWQTV